MIQGQTPKTYSGPFYTQQRLETELLSQHEREIVPLLHHLEGDNVLSSWVVNDKFSLKGQFCSLTCAFIALAPDMSPAPFILQALTFPKIWNPGKGTTWKGLLEMGEHVRSDHLGIAAEFRTSYSELEKLRATQDQKTPIEQEMEERRDAEYHFIKDMSEHNIALIASVARHLDPGRARGHQVVVLGIDKDNLGKESVILFDPDEEANYDHHDTQIRREGDLLLVDLSLWRELSHGIFLFWIPKDKIYLLDPYKQYYKLSDELYFPSTAV